MNKQETSEYLQGLGAKPVIRSFRIDQDQSVESELIFESRRLHLADNNESYWEYVKTMNAAGLPHLVANEELSNDETIVGEVPRDGRVLSQFARSMQVSARANSMCAVHMAGRTLNRLIVTQSVLPKAERFRLNGMMIARLGNYALLLPGTEFVDATEKAAAEILVTVGEEIVLPYEKFGGEVLFKAFQAGLKEE